MRQLLVDFKLTVVDQSPGKEYLGASMAAIEARSDAMKGKFGTSDKLRHADIKAHRAFLQTLTKQSDLSHTQLCDMNASSRCLEATRTHHFSCLRTPSPVSVLFLLSLYALNFNNQTPS
jgi:hypothetical protein